MISRAESRQQERMIRRVVREEFHDVVLTMLDAMRAAIEPPTPEPQPEPAVEEAEEDPAPAKAVRRPRLVRSTGEAVPRAAKEFLLPRVPLAAPVSPPETQEPEYSTLVDKAECFATVNGAEAVAIPASEPAIRPRSIAAAKIAEAEHLLFAGHDAATVGEQLDLPQKTVEALAEELRGRPSAAAAPSAVPAPAPAELPQAPKPSPAAPPAAPAPGTPPPSRRRTRNAEEDARDWLLRQLKLERMSESEAELRMSQITTKQLFANCNARRAKLGLAPFLQAEDVA